MYQYLKYLKDSKAYRVSEKSYKTKLWLTHSGPDYFAGITMNGEEPLSYITEKKTEL